MPPTIHGNMSGKNGISTDKTVFLSLLAGETRLCPDKSPMLPLPTGAQFGPFGGGDNTLTIKQKSILPVSKTRQDKSLFRLLSGAYPPPLDSGFVSHLLCRNLAIMDFRRTCATTIRHRLPLAPVIRST